MGMSMAQGAFLYPPEGLSNEFSVLSDFLESLDDGSFFGQPTTVTPSLMSSPGYTNPVSLGVDNPYIANPPGLPPPITPATPEKPSEEPAPVVLPAATKTERFFLTAADQASGSRNERLNMVIRSKYEAGLLKPYNYVKGYARLSRWMDRNVSLESKQKILQPLSVLRPKFRAIAQSESLTDIDLVFIEEAFERLLLDYDRANREFAELVGVDGYMLRDGRLCIYELMAEDSAVNYWEKYGNVAFDSNQKAVLTTCVLRYKPLLPSSGSSTPARGKSQQSALNEEGFISCCFSFTIRRDPYGIPTLIVGNFIKC
ncbi:Regulator of drug sensitivity 2 [Grifola frondosa]|uniref:Regulator of drug sensitivity 2 n=1 Tax=Grifola frondosa TaxID=5627 RepID=A0A1C7MJB9_GRIFR|nr:Regulator of drug sensitivity 2 [Grifola frondosa]